MGIIFIFVGLVAFIVSMIFGVLAIIRHHKQIKAGQGGSWLAFSIIALLAFITTLSLGMLSFSELSSGAPTEHEINHFMLSAALFGSAPGLALIFGALNAKILKIIGSFMFN